MSEGSRLESTIEALRKIHLFEGIEPAGLKVLAELAEEKRFKGGEKVFSEGDTGGSLFLIEEGKVRISRNVSGMGEEALAILGPGDAFGEMALFEDYPRSADAIVHESCRLLSIDKNALDEMLFLNRDLAYEILWNVVRILSSRLRETNDKMTFLTVTGKF